jgi:hypothetical protein
MVWHMHAPTFNKWHKKNKNKNKKVTLHKLTHGVMWGCGLTSLVVCINDKIRDIREKCDNKEQDLNYGHPFPRVWDIREWMTLWRLILHSVGHIIGDSTTKEALISLSKSFSKLCLESPHCRIRIRNLVERKSIYPSNENGLVRTRPRSSVSCLTKNHLTRSLIFGH